MKNIEIKCHPYYVYSNISTFQIPSFRFRNFETPGNHNSKEYQFSKLIIFVIAFKNWLPMVPKKQKTFNIEIFCLSHEKLEKLEDQTEAEQYYGAFKHMFGVNIPYKWFKNSKNVKTLKWFPNFSDFRQDRIPCGRWMHRSHMAPDPVRFKMGESVNSPM